LYTLGKSGEIVQKLHFGRFMVDAAAVMDQAVRDNNVGGPVNMIVAGDLVENRLIQRNMGCLTFYQQERLACPVEY
jgi:hypothetical protein